MVAIAPTKAEATAMRADGVASTDPNDVPLIVTDTQEACAWLAGSALEIAGAAPQAVYTRSAERCALNPGL